MMSATRGPVSPKSKAGTRGDRVRALSWGAFMRVHPRGHLLMGNYGAEESSPKEIRSRAVLLKRLASTVCQLDHYAVTTLRNCEDGDVTMVGFERRQDADRLSQVVNARIVPRIGNWKSNRSFNFDAKASRRIARYLAGGEVPGAPPFIGPASECQPSR